MMAEWEDDRLMCKTAEHIRALDKAERALEKVKRSVPCEFRASYCSTVCAQASSPRSAPLFETELQDAARC